MFSLLSGIEEPIITCHYWAESGLSRWSIVRLVKVSVDTPPVK